MSRSANRLIGSYTIVRLVRWLMPPHRKDWTDAMLNELAYIETRRAAVRWIIGSMLLAIRERSTYELEKASMNTGTIKTILILGVVTVGVLAGTYAIQKPYQQERIKFALHRLLDAKQS